MRASNREALRGRWHLLTFVTVVHAPDVHPRAELGARAPGRLLAVDAGRDSAWQRARRVLSTDYGFDEHQVLRQRRPSTRDDALDA
jgi:hypothetical protein